MYICNESNLENNWMIVEIKRKHGVCQTEPLVLFEIMFKMKWIVWEYLK